MNDTRLRGLAVAGIDAAGRKSLTTTPRQLGTLNARSEMQPLLGDPKRLRYITRIGRRGMPTQGVGAAIARDEAPVSASSLLRELNDPAARLFQAVLCYTDGLHVAAEELVGPQIVAELDRVDHYIPGLTTEPAWPTLRARLLALAAGTEQHPFLHLQTAAFGRDLSTAGDMAAVLDWRLTALAPTNPGPLPWLPGIPPTLHDHPFGGPIWQSDPI